MHYSNMLAIIGLKKKSFIKTYSSQTGLNVFNEFESFKGVITWDGDEFRSARICNFCSRLHKTGTKRLVDYMRPVQTQKHEIIGAI